MALWRFARLSIEAVAREGRRQADDLGNSNECHPIFSVAISSQ